MKQMKLIAIILLAVAFMPAKAQVIESITALQPYDAVIDWAKENKFDDPTFLACGAISGNIEGIPIEMKIEADGKTTAWGYFLSRESNPSTMISLAVMDSPLGDYSVFEIDPEVLPDDILISGTPLDVSLLIDSDEAFAAMKADAEYQSVMQQVSESEYSMVGLTTNDFLPDLIAGDPYYTIFHSTNLGEFTVYVHAISREVTIRLLFDDVDNKTAESGISIFPNPARESVHIKSILPGTADVVIIDQLGRKVYGQKFCGGNTIDISSFASGVYYVEIRYQHEIIRKKFIKY
jgi:hypothetical protein